MGEEEKPKHFYYGASSGKERTFVKPGGSRGILENVTKLICNFNYEIFLIIIKKIRLQSYF